MIDKEQIKIIKEWAEKVIDQYGNAQKIIAIEELGELIQAITKDIRGKPDYENLAEEIGDVILVITQLMLLYERDKPDFIKNIKASEKRKMLRTMKRIAEGEEWQR